MSVTGNLFTISAPSGAGKTSLVKALRKHDKNICVSISHTTRTQRSVEQDGVDYHFVDTQEFNNLIAQKKMLEHAEVFGHCYGTSRIWVEQTLAQGLDVVLEIDWQGRNQVLSQIPETIAITILPPSRESLLQRLADRGTDDQHVIARRMSEANKEISHFPDSHYLIVNADFDQALGELATIFASERLKTPRQRQNHAQLLNNLLATNT